MKDWEVILTTDSAHRAHIWRSRLEAEGIAAHVMPKSHSPLGVLASGMLDSALTYELWVPLSLAPKALLLLDDHD